MIRKFYIVLLALMLPVIPAAAATPVNGFQEKMARLIKSADAKAISANFDVMVDLAVPENAATYSKAQAMRILQAFFAQYTVKDFRIERSGTADDGSEYFAGTLETSKKRFTLSVRYRVKGDENLIYQFRVVE